MKLLFHVFLLTVQHTSNQSYSFLASPLENGSVLFLRSLKVRRLFLSPVQQAHQLSVTGARDSVEIIQIRGELKTIDKRIQYAKLSIIEHRKRITYESRLWQLLYQAFNILSA
jgi:hypothetical protein